MSEDGSAPRSRYWVAGVAGWLVISAVCLLTHLGSLETNLAERSQIALRDAGLSGQITNSDISFTGEIATLRGTVDDADLSVRIADVVADVSGVRKVNNEIVTVAGVAPEPAAPTQPTTTPAPSPAALPAPRLSAIVDGVTITLSGQVPSQDIADAWVAAATTTYGADNVVDRLIVSDEVGSAGWLANADSMRLLDATSDGSITIDGDRLVVTGLVADAAARDQILASLAAGFPELTIDDQTLIAPDASREIGSFDLSGITFETGSATITTDSVAILDAAVLVLAAFPDVPVEVAGHTDSDGSAAANLGLSQARADAVVEYLVNNGIDAERLTAVGYGETQPIADNATPAGKAQNRRIAFVITEGE